MFLNQIDNLHNHDNSIILIFIFLIRIDTIQKPGNALITQFSDIIERIKSQPSAQRSTQNRNVGYTYFYSPNLNEIISPSITLIKYSYTISEICNLVQKLYMFLAYKIGGWGHARVMLKILTMNLFYKYSMNIHHLQKMLVTNLVLATKCYRVSWTVTKDYWVHYCNKIWCRICGNWGNNTVRSMFFYEY